MKTAARLLAPVIAFALCACGSEPGSSSSGTGGAEPGGTGGSASGGEAGSGGSSGSGGEAGAPIEVFYASFMPEQQAGESPASVSFENDTQLTMTLWLEQATFTAVAPGASSGPLLAASAAVELDTKTGKHVENACVQFDISALEGSKELTPGAHYSMRIELDKSIGFVGTLTETSGEQFVGLRAKILDPSTNAFRPSDLTLGDERGHIALSWRVADSERTAYSHAGAGTASGMLRFVSGDRRVYTATENVSVAGAPGYTIVVDDQPLDGAAAVIELHAEP